MKLINEKVSNIKYGKGVIVNQDERYVHIEFENVDGIKKFVYPDAFEKFLEINSKVKSKKVQKELDVINEAKHVERMKQAEIEVARLHELALEGKLRRQNSTHNDGNIVIKFNYCDGGSTDTKIGFAGVCSEKILEHNVKKEKYVGCASDDSECKNYSDGAFSYSDLQLIYANDGSVCYESQLLSDWNVHAGLYQSGKRAGKPVKFKNIKGDGLAMLSTKLPKTKEKDRFIFAVFLIDEFFEGNQVDAGRITADKKYRLQLSLEEAKELKFWNYYYNNKSPEKVRFGSGLHRYFSNDQSTQVLQKICELKKGTPDETLALELLEEFCRINKMDSNNILKADGALLRGE